jgi:hypothetical protein
MQREAFVCTHTYQSRIENMTKQVGRRERRYSHSVAPPYPSTTQTRGKYGAPPLPPGHLNYWTPDHWFVYSTTHAHEHARARARHTERLTLVAIFFACDCVRVCINACVRRPSSFPCTLQSSRLVAAQRTRENARGKLFGFQFPSEHLSCSSERSRE